MLAGRRTSTESILTFFEGENIVSPPQNRRVCDGLVTARCTQFRAMPAGAWATTQWFLGRQPSLTARAERSADFQDRDGGILLRPLFGSPLFKDAVRGFGDQGSNPNGRLRISCPASSRRS
jgi:hypothetical protein